MLTLQVVQHTCPGTARDHREHPASVNRCEMLPGIINKRYIMLMGLRHIVCYKFLFVTSVFHIFNASLIKYGDASE